MKNKYVKPELENIYVEVKDILAISGFVIIENNILGEGEGEIW